jgi:glycosyltransferase involved in cell wall biosynthesis
VLAPCDPCKPCDEPRARTTVLHLAQPADGGVARVVADLAEAQVREGLRTVVACPGGGLADEASAAGAETPYWPAVREPGAYLATEVYAAARLVRRVRPDLVHLHSAKAGLAGRLALRGRIPTVFQPHAWSFEAVSGSAARAAVAWERYAARWTDRVLCVSENERRRGVRAGVHASWAVVHNGVRTARFTGVAPIGSGSGDGEARESDRRTHRRTDRAALGTLGTLGTLDGLDAVPPEAPLVVCVGRLCEQKGQELLLSAWPRIAEQAAGARLVLVGDGPYRRRLSLLAPHGTVFAGGGEDVARWYEAADVVVLPSRWEGMALTPLEAMACGRPVVVTDVGGARESLPAGHRRWCLVPPGDVDALAGAVAQLLNDPRLRAELGAAAQRHVREKFDVRRTTARVSRLYGELLAARTPRTAGRVSADCRVAVR